MQRNGVVLPTIGALAAAVIGGVLWALIAVVTDYELGLVAWAIGGMSGYAVSYLSGRRTGVTHQIIAVVASLIGILLGKYFIFAYMFNEGMTGMFDSVTFTLFQEVFSDLFGGMDIVFVLLAVVTAWQLPPKLARPDDDFDRETETVNRPAE
ncbi:hypothetical protein E5161_09815 [Cohnella pontilimi]|uniref:Uncharacterized protein n=1 Tax=Cohnella pontilimi TaxID=2564100 RepID=A0A4U0FBR5_9BACL|nr:hypothetical protein [Cohnella pontilimi]TJY42286.1 hypothetical protein E5161_09815 [Cohnella pontilimi]